MNIQKYLGLTYKLKLISLRYIKDHKFNFKADVFIHLSGIAHDLKKITQAKNYFDANFELTKQIFDCFLNSESEVFIFMSSVKAVVDKNVNVITEKTVPCPKTIFGQSKYEAEQYLLSQPLPAGKRVFILRPCMIHGPGNKGNLNLLYQIVAKRIPWPLGAFENQRSFCSIENVCFVINEILENESIPSGIYNLADDEAISTNKLITLIADSQNKKAHILKISKGVISGIAKIGDVLKLPLNSERLQKLTESYVVSNEKMVKAIGKPLPFSAEEGLVKTFQSFKLSN
jgi:nucleoside-diphosphate-sugar epimerase